MKYLYLWAFSFIVFSVVCSTSGASIDITTIIPLEDEEDSTELYTLDYNNDSVPLEEEGDSTETIITTTSTTTTTTTSTTTTTTTTTEEPEKSPKFIRVPSNIQAFSLGEPFALECYAESIYDQNIKYFWTKNGRQFKVDDSQNVFSESSLNGNILFTKPTMNDVGTYQCEAINSYGKVFSQASLLRAKQPRNQPRRLNILSPVAAQILVDPTIETKDTIERIPITQAVPEILPNLIQPQVFVVYPGTPEEPAVVMNMEVVDDTNSDDIEN